MTDDRNQLTDNAANAVAFSVVVVIVSDTLDGHCDLSHLSGCLESIYRQQGSPNLEIIVPYLAGSNGMEEFQKQHPSVIFLPCNDLKTVTGQGGSREHHDELRARGLAVAQGRLVGLLEDHARADPHWAAAMTDAHRGPAAAIGGAIENGIDRALNWSVYFCDFGKYQNPVPSGSTPFASDANICYKRAALNEIRKVWQHIFHETAVNWALRSKGESITLCSSAIVYQHRIGLRFGHAVQERFVWGRSYAATRSRTLSPLKRLTLAALSPALPAILLARMAMIAMKRRLRLVSFLKVLPLTALLTISWSCGELVGYVTGHTGTRSKASEAQAVPRTFPVLVEGSGNAYRS